MKIARLSAADDGFERVAEAPEDPRVVETVGEIIAHVRAEGDAAVLEYTRRFDRVKAERIDDLRISADAAAAALKSLDAGLRSAMELAAERIRDYSERQALDSWETSAGGVTLGQRVTPLDSAGVYVPGGAASYPSSVLMNVIPAHIAGVPRIAATVPAREGELSPAVLAAFALCEVEEMWMVGGAQAVAALAYGTESIRPVAKIVGPGNAYVAEAKRQVFGQVGIDSIAGASEVVIVGDGGGDPEWAAADLIAQAEHDENVRVVLLCPDGAFLDKVEDAIEGMLAAQPRRRIIEAALENKGCFMEVADLDAALDAANRIAPEHLQLAFDGAEERVDEVRNAGAIFIGRHTSAVLGDYCAGPNHVLPTGGTARFSSPLGVYEFQKRSSTIACTAAAAAALGETAATLAEAEGLYAHATAASLRRNLRRSAS